MIFNTAIVVFALSVTANALPQTYPNKCGDQVCPADKAKCCEVIVNGVAELGCFAECPPVQALQRRQPYPNKCGDQVSLQTRPNAARLLSTELLKLDALRNALLHLQLQKSFSAASNLRKLLQHLRPLPPLVPSAETLSSALSAKSAALMRSSTVPTLTRSTNSALSK